MKKNNANKKERRPSPPSELPLDVSMCLVRNADGRFICDLDYYTSNQLANAALVSAKHGVEKVQKMRLETTAWCITLMDAWHATSLTFQGEVTINSNAPKSVVYGHFVYTVREEERTCNDVSFPVNN